MYKYINGTKQYPKGGNIYLKIEFSVSNGRVIWVWDKCMPLKKEERRMSCLYFG